MFWIEYIGVLCKACMRNTVKLEQGNTIGSVTP